MPNNNEYIDARQSGGTLYDAGTLKGGRIRTIIKTFEVAAADTDGFIYRILEIPSSAVITAIQLSCDAITGGTDYDIGVYNTQKRGGAVVSKDCLLDGQTMATALRNANGFLNPNIDSLHKELWEHASTKASLSLTADPSITYDLAVTANTVGSADGTITLVISYQ